MTGSNFPSRACCVRSWVRKSRLEFYSFLFSYLLVPLLYFLVEVAQIAFDHLDSSCQAFPKYHLLQKAGKSFALLAYIDLLVGTLHPVSFEYQVKIFSYPLRITTAAVPSCITRAYKICSVPT